MTVLEDVKANRRKLKDRLEGLSLRITAAPAAEARKLKTDFDAGVSELETYDARIEELTQQALREQRSAAAGTGPSFHTSPVSGTYRDPHEDSTSPSFFRDLRNSRLGDWDAAERLQRNERERGLERRAGDMTTVANAGGQFAPPLWLVEQFVALARPGRVTADLTTKDKLPDGVSSINLPKVASGTTTAVQILQNTAVSDTAVTSASVASGVTTIAGKQIVSLQLIQQSGIPFDRIILADLAADYAKQLDLQVISGTGANGQLRGLINGASVGATTWTTASPAVTSATAANSFYNAVVKSSNAVNVARFVPPTAIVMHPNRWSWVLEGLDTTTRPLVVPNGQGSLNALGQAGAVAAQGSVGSFAGLPVYTDPNVPVNLGGGTNEDRVFVARFEDCYLYESDLRMESFEATYADQASVLFRALGYSAFIPDRLGAAVNIIAGTGLIAPVL